MVSKIKVDEIESSQAGGDITFNTLPKIGGVSNFGRKNYIINGNFDIWQRGTSFGSGAGYTADRWRNNLNGGTIARDQGSFTVGQTDVPNNPEFYYDFDRTVANTGTNLFLEQRIEDVKTLSSETVTVSFWAKYTTNAPTSLNIRFVQNFGSGGSANVFTDLTTTQTITSSWVKYTLTGTIPSISGKTVGSGNYVALQFQNQNLEVFDIQIAQVQVEKGSVATDFEFQHPGDILLQCRRYFHFVTIWSGTWTSYPSGFAFGNGNGTGSARMTYESPSMQNFRTTPTVSWEGTNNQSGSFRSHRLADNAFNDTQFVQNVSFGFDPWYDGGTAQGLCQMHILWGSTSSTGTFSNQHPYRMSAIANSPKIRVLLDAEL